MMALSVTHLLTPRTGGVNTLQKSNAPLQARTWSHSERQMVLMLASIQHHGSLVLFLNPQAGLVNINLRSTIILPSHSKKPQDVVYPTATNVVSSKSLQKSHKTDPFSDFVTAKQRRIWNTGSRCVPCLAVPGTCSLQRRNETLPTWWQKQTD